MKNIHFKKIAFLAVVLGAVLGGAAKVFADYWTYYNYSIPYTVVAPPTVTVTADATTVPYNSFTYIRWSSTNATSCVDFNGAAAATNGTLGTGNLTATKTFTITCK